MPASDCRICEIVVESDSLVFSDGSLVHQECFINLQSAPSTTEAEIQELNRYVKNLSSEIERRDGIVFLITSLFSNPGITTEALKEKLTVWEQRIAEKKLFLSELQNILEQIYDVYLTYPPDWESRRENVVVRDGNNCSECRSTKNLHLHHITPLARGGSNKLSNLKLLCSNCHSSAHGGRDFSGEFGQRETSFSKRLVDISYAIENKKRVEFLYKKPTEKSYNKRIIQPHKLISLEHKRDSGSTLCVSGFCELRNAKRTFAIRRMKRLKVL